MDATERTGAAARAPRSASQETGLHDSPRALRRLPSSAWTPAAPIVPPDLRVAELIGVFRRRIAVRPLTSTLIALGAGFVLGGALSFRAGRMALAIVGRHAMQEVLKELL